MSDSAEAVAISCSLDASSLAERVEQWRALLATSVVSLESDDTMVRLVLGPSDAALAAAVDLGQREKQCCEFFDVGLELGPHERVLYLRVPPGAEEAMTRFVEMLSS